MKEVLEADDSVVGQGQNLVVEIVDDAEGKLPPWSLAGLADQNMSQSFPLIVEVVVDARVVREGMLFLRHIC